MPAARAAGRSKQTDAAFSGGSMVVAGVVIAIVAGIVAVLLKNSWMAIQEFGLKFFVTNVWDPVQLQFGALAYIYGTLVTSTIALLLAAPIAIGAAIFLVEYAPGWFRGPIGFLTEMLAAIPSIIYGLWGFFVLAPFMRDYVEPWLQTYIGPIPVIGFQSSASKPNCTRCRLWPPTLRASGGKALKSTRAEPTQRTGFMARREYTRTSMKTQARPVDRIDALARQ